MPLVCLRFVGVFSVFFSGQENFYFSLSCSVYLPPVFSLQPFVSSEAEVKGKCCYRLIKFERATRPNQIYDTPGNIM